MADRLANSVIMIYYVSKAFWLIAAPTNALVLISAIAAFWGVLRRSNCVTQLAAAVASGLVIGTFTPIGLAITVPLEYRFPPFRSPDPQAPLDGIILLGGCGIEGIAAVATLSKSYPKARLIFSGFKARGLTDMFARLGGDLALVYMESRRGCTLHSRVAQAETQ
jgi:hypothetical protein